MIGMVSFTGAVIGYITNYISNFIETANSGTRKVKITNHTIILNWNTRASEIVNDLLYSETKEKVVVLANTGKESIEREIYDRISDTLSREHKALLSESKDMPFFEKRRYISKHRLKNNLTIIVKEGDVFSSKALHDISVDYAKSIIILGKDIHNSLCKYEYEERMDEHGKGNSNTIKTLIQVADITASEESADNQKIVVEVEDEWTYDLVNQIIKHKENLGKCNIVPVPINRILGQILSQFSVMPELNNVYNELFSNKGAAFYTEEREVSNEKDYILSYLNEHRHAIPLTTMQSDNKSYFYYSSGSQKEISKKAEVGDIDYSVFINKDY